MRAGRFPPVPRLASETVQLNAAADGPRDHATARSSNTARGPRLSGKDVGLTVLAVLIASLVTAVLLAAAWLLDQRVLKCGSGWRQVSALALLGIGSWVVLVVLLSHALQVPGCYGPPQYWDDDGRAFMWVRAVALLLVVLGFVVALACALATLAVMRWHACVLPFTAVAAYVAGMWVFFARAFWPTA